MLLLIHCNCNTHKYTRKLWDFV